MTFGTYEEAPRIWGIGRIVVDGMLTPWPVSETDINDEAESLAPRLAGLGLEDDGLVLIVSLLSEAIHVVPLEKAAGKVGALYSSADATPFDAFRTDALIRQLHPSVVIGIDGGVLDGLVDAGKDLGAVFSPVPAVVARDATSATRLRDAGLSPRGWARIGPTSALQSLDDDAFVYDDARWEITARDDELRITNLVDRLTPSDNLSTGVRGTILEPGRLELADF